MKELIEVLKEYKKETIDTVIWFLIGIFIAKLIKNICF